MGVPHGLLLFFIILLYKKNSNAYHVSLSAEHSTLEASIVADRPTVSYLIKLCDNLKNRMFPQNFFS
jgi:hypothetical protein